MWVHFARRLPGVQPVADGRQPFQRIAVRRGPVEVGGEDVFNSPTNLLGGLQRNSTQANAAALAILPDKLNRPRAVGAGGDAGHDELSFLTTAGVASPFPTTDRLHTAKGPNRLLNNRDHCQIVSGSPASTTFACFDQSTPVNRADHS